MVFVHADGFTTYGQDGQAVAINKQMLSVVLFTKHAAREAVKVYRSVGRRGTPQSLRTDFLFLSPASTRGSLQLPEKVLHGLATGELCVHHCP